MEIDINEYQREFAGPRDRLKGLYFQILLHEYNNCLFSRSDWTNFSLSYGQLFYRYELLWSSTLEKFEGLNKTEIKNLLDTGLIERCDKAFEESSNRMSGVLEDINYDLNEAYIDMIDLDSFSPISDVNHPLVELFLALKGNFTVIDHVPGVWLFNAVNIENKLQELNDSFKRLFNSYLQWDVANFLSSFFKYSNEQKLKLQLHVSGEKEAITQEWGLQPDLLTWPIDRVIYAIGLKYCKVDGTRLSPKSIRREVNRMKKKN